MSSEAQGKHNGRDSVRYRIIDGIRIPYRVRPYEYPTSSNNDTTSTFEKLVFADFVRIIFGEANDLLLKKHEAYGPKNISQAPGGPENGLRVRMWDKMARLNHILDNPDVDTNDESLEDTLQDLLNYCAIFIMVRRGQWPDTLIDNGPDCG